MFFQRCVLLFTGLIVLIQTMALSQQIELGSRTYKLKDSKWYNYSSGQQGDEIYPYRLIVRLQNRQTPSPTDFLNLGILTEKIVSHSLFGDYHVVILNKKSDPMVAAKTLHNSEQFDYVEFDASFRVHFTPNDEYWNKTFNDTVPGLWNLKPDRLDMPKAWDITKGNSERILAVIDKGFNGLPDHIDLKDNLWYNPDDPANGIDDDNNGCVDDTIGCYFYVNGNKSSNVERDVHGTRVAGVAIARSNNDSSIAGVAGGWGTDAGVQLMCLATEDSSNGDISAIAVGNAIKYATEHGADVMNMSFGSSNSYSYIEDQIDTAVDDSNSVLVASTGNEENNQFHTEFPANYSKVIAVGAVDTNDYLMEVSKYDTDSSTVDGKEIDIVAPGWVISTDSEDEVLFTYTSAAAPHVSGVVSLLRSINNDLDYSDVREIITTTVDTAIYYTSGSSIFYNSNNWSKFVGYGRINAYKALKYTIENYGGTIGGNGETVRLHEDITLQSGKTLTIASGTLVKVAANKKITVKGTLKASNVEFRCANSQAEWAGIVFDSSSCSASDLFGCEITEVTNGIEIKGTSARPTIEECYINAEYYPIKVNNLGNPQIINCHLYSDQNHAVYIVNGHGDFTECEFRVGDGDNNNSAIYVSGASSAPDFDEKYGNTGNLFDFNNIDGEGAVLAGGIPEFGDDPILGLNDFENFSASNNYYIDNNTGSSVKAEGNWWGTSNDSVISSRFDGTVDFSPKESSSNSAGPDWSVSKTLYNPFADGFDSFRNGNYQKALDDLLSAFSQHKSHDRAGHALFKIATSAYLLGVLDDHKDLLQAHIQSSYPQIAHQARNWLSLLLASNSHLTEAENVIGLTEPGSLSRRELLLQLVCYYQAYDKKSDVDRIVATLRETFATDEKIEADIAVMKQHPFSFENAKGGLAKPGGSHQTNQDLALSTHPNPFNSITTIRFELANERHITLEIYDVLGRRVQTLIDTKLGTGTHAIHWNGRNTFDHEVASGLYFVLLQTPMDNDTRKVLLVR